MWAKSPGVKGVKNGKNRRFWPFFGQNGILTKKGPKNGLFLGTVGLSSAFLNALKSPKTTGSDLRSDRDEGPGAKSHAFGAF